MNEPREQKNDGDQFLTAASRNVKKFYHAASNTHICYQENIGSFGIRGIGDFADEAYRDYLNNIKSWLNAATSREVEVATANILDVMTGFNEIREIQIRVPELVKDRVRRLAADDGISISDYIVKIIRQTAMNVSSGKIDIPTLEKRAKVVKEEMKHGHETAAISFRIDSAQLAYLARVIADGNTEAGVLKDIVLNFYQSEIVETTAG